MFDGLVAVKPDGSIEPRLAASRENKDNTVWTFHLRPGITGQMVLLLPRRMLLSGAGSAGLAANGFTLFFVFGQYACCKRPRYCSREKDPATLGVKALDDNTLEII